MKLITETSYEFRIEEDAKSKNLYLMGIFSSADTKNKNGRIYPKSLLEREIENLKKIIPENQCLGQLGHPEDPEGSLEKVAIVVEDLQWKGNDVMGKARVLNNRQSGQHLKDLIADGIKVGISSRGLGTVNESTSMVNDDFQLLTYDIVSKPSNHGSWLNGIYEAKEFAPVGMRQQKSLDEMKKEVLDEHYKKIWQVIQSFKDKR